MEGYLRMIPIIIPIFIDKKDSDDFFDYLGDIEPRDVLIGTLIGVGVPMLILIPFLICMFNDWTFVELLNNILKFIGV